MPTYAIVIHGGAENKSREEIGEQEAEYRKGIEEALEAGHAVLRAGGPAVEAVEVAVRSMENNYLFNAGKGGAFSKEREISFDAAIMDGHTLEAGAVANVKNVRNPISLARAIKDHSDHVLLVGEGAQMFAREMDLEMEQEAYFETEKQAQELQKTLEEKEEDKPPLMKDTVGAVALDQQGNLAAATSTGGLVGQYKGRVGDSPIIGGGTYANNEVCAVSCTGDGEAIMRAGVAHEVYALMKHKGLSLQDACVQARTLYKEKITGDRNLIAIDKDGNIAMEFETSLMFRGYRRGSEEPYVGIWKD
jgi:beta-aspartyl-peptidase (threonine type)